MCQEHIFTILPIHGMFYLGSGTIPVISSQSIKRKTEQNRQNHEKNNLC